MTIKRRMTAPEFEAVQPLLKKMSQDRRDSAYAVLVNDIPYTKVAAQYGCTRQAIGDSVKIVWDAFQLMLVSQAADDKAIVPPGWERATLVAPAELMSSFREIINIFRLESKKNNTVS